MVEVVPVDQRLHVPRERHRQRQVEVVDRVVPALARRVVRRPQQMTRAAVETGLEPVAHRPGHPHGGHRVVPGAVRVLQAAAHPVQDAGQPAALVDPSRPAPPRRRWPPVARSPTPRRPGPCRPRAGWRRPAGWRSAASARPGRSPAPRRPSGRARAGAVPTRASGWRRAPSGRRRRARRRRSSAARAPAAAARSGRPDRRRRCRSAATMTRSMAASRYRSRGPRRCGRPGSLGFRRAGGTGGRTYSTVERADGSAAAGNGGAVGGPPMLQGRRGGGRYGDGGRPGDGARPRRQRECGRRGEGPGRAARPDVDQRQDGVRVEEQLGALERDVDDEAEPVVAGDARDDGGEHAAPAGGLPVEGVQPGVVDPAHRPPAGRRAPGGRAGTVPGRRRRRSSRADRCSAGAAPGPPGRAPTTS